MALKHLGLSIFVAAAAAAVVFGVWYPYPYREVSGGRELFSLLIAVDVVAGPVLTLVAFDPDKPRTVWWRDALVIGTLQIAALVYGLGTVMAARPAYLAFESDRFRVVTVAEIEPDTLGKAPEALRRLPLSGPRTIGTRLAQPTDPDYLVSLQQSLEGLPPSLRPERWILFEGQRERVRSRAKPLSELRRKQPQQAATIDEAVRSAALPEEQLGFVPMQSRTTADWVVLVNLANGEPVAYAPVDGW